MSSNKSKQIKERMRHSSKYALHVGQRNGYLHFLCHLYYSNNVTPSDLIKFQFIGRDVKNQSAFVSKYKYESTKQYLPILPANEIMDSDWYEIIIPQFLAYELTYPSINLHRLNQNNLNEIGLDLLDYSKLKLY